ncbi:MAG: HD-GYP domain-containing protein [Thermodesulfobacteriota bacterium]
MEKIDSLLRNINSATRNIRLYPSGHPAIESQFSKTLQEITELFKTNNRIFIGKTKDVLVFNETPIMDAEEKIGDLIFHMDDKGVEGIIFEKGITNNEFSDFIDLLSGEESIKGRALQKKLHEKGIKHITLKSMSSGKKTIVDIYNDAIDIVKDAMNEMRMGRIPKTAEITSVVNGLTDAVLSNRDAMIGLTMIKDYDNYLYNHSVNVCILALALAQHMKYDKKNMVIAGMGGLLHDIGKTGVSENIIKKSGVLSSEEWDKVKEHPLLGSQAIERMATMDKFVARIVLEHHVRYDHSGYPQTDNTNLHPLSMIITIVDAYDALTTLRVYQKPYHPTEALQILNGLSGKHFEPNTTRAFINMLGVFPIGTLVRLSTNEVGIVTALNNENEEKPILKVVFNNEGERIEPPLEVDLSKEDENERFIVSPVDPLSKGIYAGLFFEEEFGSLPINGDRKS